VALTYDVREIVHNVEIAKSMFGWKPGISMQEGLAL